MDNLKIQAIENMTEEEKLKFNSVNISSKMLKSYSLSRAIETSAFILIVIIAANILHGMGFIIFFVFLLLVDSIVISKALDVRLDKYRLELIENMENGIKFGRENKQ